MMTPPDAQRVLQNPRIWDQPTVVEAMEVRLEAARATAQPMSAPQRSTEARDDAFWAAMGIACLIAVAVVFVVSDGIARAFDRPEACLHLSAAECSAYHQEAR